MYFLTYQASALRSAGFSAKMPLRLAFGLFVQKFRLVPQGYIAFSECFGNNAFACFILPKKQKSRIKGLSAEKWYNIRGLVRSFPDYLDKHQIEGKKDEHWYDQ